MKRRVKRYAEGEMVEGDEIPMDTETRRSIKDYMTNPAKETEGGYTSPVKEYEREAKAPVKKRKRVAKYSDVVKASDLGSQNFSAKPSTKKEESTSSAAVPAALGGAGAAAVLAKLVMGKRGEAKEPSLTERVKAREARSQSGSTVGKMPGSSLSDPYSMQLGSDLDVKRTLRGNKRMGMDDRDTEFKKGGKTKKMAGGGSASSRADGIAQRGKTRGRIC